MIIIILAVCVLLVPLIIYIYFTLQKRGNNNVNTANASNELPVNQNASFGNRSNSTEETVYAIIPSQNSTSQYDNAILANAHDVYAIGEVNLWCEIKIIKSALFITKNDICIISFVSNCKLCWSISTKLVCFNYFSLFNKNFYKILCFFSKKKYKRDSHDQPGITYFQDAT